MVPDHLRHCPGLSTDIHFWDQWPQEIKQFHFSFCMRFGFFFIITSLQKPASHVTQQHQTSVYLSN